MVGFIFKAAVITTVFWGGVYRIKRHPGEYLVYRAGVGDRLCASCGDTGRGIGRGTCLRE